LTALFQQLSGAAIAQPLAGANAAMDPVSRLTRRKPRARATARRCSTMGERVRITFQLTRTVTWDLGKL
jgi:hypothetical protein